MISANSIQPQDYYRYTNPRIKCDKQKHVVCALTDKEYFIKVCRG